MMMFAEFSKLTTSLLLLANGVKSTNADVLKILALYDFEAPDPVEITEAVCSHLNDDKDGFYDNVFNEKKNLTFECVVRDVRCNDKLQAAEQYKKGVELFNPHVIVGGHCSPDTSQIANTASADAKVTIAPSATLTILSIIVGTYFMSAPDNENGNVGATVSFLEEMKWDEVIIIKANNEWAQGFGAQFHLNFEGRIVKDYTVTFSNVGEDDPSRNDVTAALGDLAETIGNHRIVLLLAHTLEASSILLYLSVLDGFPHDAQIVGIDWSPQILDTAGATPFGIWCLQQNRMDVEYHDEYYTTHFPEKPEWHDRSSRVRVDDFVPRFIDALVTAAMALARADDPTNFDHVRLAMQRVRFMGAGGMVEFKAQYRIGMFFNVTRNEDGKFVSVGSLDGPQLTTTMNDDVKPYPKDNVGNNNNNKKRMREHWFIHFISGLILTILLEFIIVLAAKFGWDWARRELDRQVENVAGFYHGVKCTIQIEHWDGMSQTTRGSGSSQRKQGGRSASTAAAGSAGTTRGGNSDSKTMAKRVVFVPSTVRTVEI